ncbi:hypothetical protein MsAg5_03100 [Methanosarcinaceae archaeon Ag5]|uniref:Uncharacterized protein n=1 Tax=Methanolapillus africanus TaxID=3028297 RepID=A0AAE4SCJ7_9EURY|nr:hypothetical protein [Methanosarcinaceae archaeon Ag5]
MKPIRNFHPTEFSVGVAIVVGIQLFFLCFSYLSSSPDFSKFNPWVTTSAFVILALYGALSFNSFYIVSQERIFFSYWLNLLFSFTGSFIYLFVILAGITFVLSQTTQFSGLPWFDYLCTFISCIFYLFFFTLIDKLFSKPKFGKLIKKREESL